MVKRMRSEEEGLELRLEKWPDCRREKNAAEAAAAADDDKRSESDTQLIFWPESDWKTNKVVKNVLKMLSGSHLISDGASSRSTSSSSSSSSLPSSSSSRVDKSSPKTGSASLYHNHQCYQSCAIGTLIISLVLFCSMSLVSGDWQDNILPKIRITQLDNNEGVQVFKGNTTHTDHFKLLEQDGDSFLVGARNIVYNLSLVTLEENKRLEWYSTEEDIAMCRLKGKKEEDCHNYVRVLAKTSNSDIFVCGTNSFRPRCRHYLQQMDNYKMSSEISGEGLCPYDPHHNSTAVFAADNLYVATVAQFSGADPLIYREPLRTEQYNPKHLNAPSFVSSLHHSEHVYFFFRETAVEYLNCGKRVYSRVARVCTKDKGGPHKLQNHWTSFLKARLNCSIPGEFPFYFDHIQSTTHIVNGVYNGKSQQIIYAVFTTPPNSIPGSAVCAFRMADILDAFDGPFKGQENGNSNWLPVPNSKVPSPRPGVCVNDSRALPESTLNFLKDHSLMDTTVNAFWKSPLVLQTSLKFRFTKIAVDPQIETATGETYDVMFIATDDGRIIKAINADSYVEKDKLGAGVGTSGSGDHHHRGLGVAPVVIEDMTVLKDKSPISNLLVYRTYYQAKLVIVSSSEIKTIPLFNCQLRASTCGKCVALQDPYCAWDIIEQKCTNSRKRLWKRDNFVQNVRLGWDPKCPDGRPWIPGGDPSSNNKIFPERDHHVGGGGSLDNDDDMSNEINPHNGGTGGGRRDSSELKQAGLYSAETLSFSIVTSIVTSFVIGFILGYIFSRRCNKDNASICSSFDNNSELFLDHRGSSSDHHTHHPHHNSYPPIGGVGGNNKNSIVNNKAINLVLNVPPKGGKNANSSADNKPVQSAKKIYL